MELFKDLSKSLPEPESYYRGLDLAVRPRCHNLIGFLRRDRRNLLQKHLANRSHHRHVLLFVQETGGSIMVDGLEIPLKPGQAYWVKPFQFHHYVNLEEEAIRWLFLTFELDDSASEQIDPSHHAITLDDQALHYWKLVLDCLTAQDTRKQVEALPLVDALLMHWTQQQAVETASPFYRSKTSWVAKVEAYLLRSVHEDFGMESIASLMHCSERHLRGRFEKETGVRLSDYRSNYQLHQALLLMRDTGRSLGQIAEACGFNSQPVFNRFIERQTGMKPSELRRSQQE